MSQTRKYEKPKFLPDEVTQTDYEEWLYRKTTAHIKRDRNRENSHSTPEEYRVAIHKAVVVSNGVDVYTGQPLRWDLVRTYNNEDSQRDGRKYKAKFADLPTVDHTGDGKGNPDFKICSWKMNDAKNDLTLEEFIDLCETVLNFHRNR